MMPTFKHAAQSLKGNLDAVKEVEEACREAKIDELDLGGSTVKDFQFELDLLDDIILQKESFIENRVSFFLALSCSSEFTRVFVDGAQELTSDHIDRNSCGKHYECDGRTTDRLGRCVEELWCWSR